MNFIKTFEQLDPNALTKDQIEFLNKFVDGSWNLVNGFVDIEGNFRAINAGLKDFKGIKFGKVTGNFSCSNNLLTSLKGAPKIVYGDFSCSGNKLISLAGCPQEVGRVFGCAYNQLITLMGSPQKAGGDFNCYSNKLTSLEGGPQKVGGDFNCYSNKLTSLTGAPQKVGGSFDCSDNLLTSLKGGPQEVAGDLDCSSNQLTSLEGFPQVLDGSFNCSGNLVSEETLKLLCNKLKEIPIYSIALASIWSKISEKDQELMKKDLDPDYSDYSQLGDFGLI